MIATVSVGSKVQHYGYSAFGKLVGIKDGSGNDIAANPVVSPHFTFTGREYDFESGLYYYRARHYDASIGRFLQRDPAPGEKTLPSTFVSGYTYALNSPTKYRDPSGRSVFNKLFGTLNSKIIISATPLLAGLTSFNNSRNSNGELWQNLAVGFTSAFFTSLAGTVAAAGNFYLTPVFSDIVTPFATGVLAFAQNAANQAIMSKGERVDWRRARNAGIQAALIHGAANAASYAFGPAAAINPVVDYFAAASGVACTDDGVSPKTEEQVASEGVLDFRCDATFGF